MQIGSIDLRVFLGPAAILLGMGTVALILGGLYHLSRAVYNRWISPRFDLEPWGKPIGPPRDGKPKRGLGEPTAEKPHAQAAALPMVVAAVGTPQEDRFGRLALTQRALTRDQLRRCLEFQARKREQGSIIPLWDCAVLQNLLDQEAAERLRQAAGDLDVDTLGQFAIVRKIGQGGMGSVWLAHGPDDSTVALKVLPADVARKRPLLTRFFREAQAAMKLEHPNIVRGVAFEEDGGRYFYAMEFVPGKSVRDMILESGPLAPGEASRIVMQTARGLAYAHEQGVIHRDIKPSNILVTREGVAKLADLGLVRRADPDLTALTPSGVGMGTPSYMAPEQIRDARRADARSDIYSLGATWYHMVTGQPPFTGGTALEVCQKHLDEPLVPPHRVRRDLALSASGIIQQMMAKQPGERIQTAVEVCRRIEQECRA